MACRAAGSAWPSAPLSMRPSVRKGEYSVEKGSRVAGRRGEQGGRWSKAEGGCDARGKENRPTARADFVRPITSGLRRFCNKGKTFPLGLTAIIRYTPFVPLAMGVRADFGRGSSVLFKARGSVGTDWEDASARSFALAKVPGAGVSGGMSMISNPSVSMPSSFSLAFSFSLPRDPCALCVSGVEGTSGLVRPADRSSRKRYVVSSRTGAAAVSRKIGEGEV